MCLYIYTNTKGTILNNSDLEKLYYKVKRIKSKTSMEEYEAKLQNDIKLEEDESMLIKKVSTPVQIRYFINRAILYVDEQSKYDFEKQCYRLLTLNRDYYNTIIYACKLIIKLNSYENDKELYSYIDSIMSDLTIDFNSFKHLVYDYVPDYYKSILDKYLLVFTELDIEKEKAKIYIKNCQN